MLTGLSEAFYDAERRRYTYELTTWKPVYTEHTAGQTAIRACVLWSFAAIINK